jgi:hypothetical protein
MTPADAIRLCQEERAKRPKVIAPEVAAAKVEFDESFANADDKRQRAIRKAIATAAGKRELTNRQRLMMKMDDEGLSELANGRYHTGRGLA